MPVKFRAIKPSKRDISRMRGLPRKLELLMGDLMTEAHGELATYPPQRAGVTYIRRGTLGRSWQHRVRAKPDRIEGEASSQGQIAPYNIYVQGPRQKPWAKATGWRTPKDVLKRLWPGWVKRVRAAMKGAV